MKGDEGDGMQDSGTMGRRGGGDDRATTATGWLGATIGLGQGRRTGTTDDSPPQLVTTEPG
jgi:hypothetical protein